MNTNKLNHLTEDSSILFDERIDIKDNAAVLNSLTLAEVKNEIALERGYTSWDYLIAANLYNEKLRDEVSERYAASKLSAYQTSKN